MFPAVDTKDAAAVARQVQAIYQEIVPGADDYFITRAFGWVLACFEGRCPGYQALDVRYHDIEHTLQGTLCLVRLLRNRHLAGAEPLLTPHNFELAMLAMLMHDSGYLKRSDDLEGTGAKYTVTHVRRSGEFAREFLVSRNYTGPDIESIQNMIRCTGINVDLNTIPFSTELEKTLGLCIGTSDLLGQMAADDYVDKLPLLYEEFAEALRFDGRGGGTISFKNADDLMRNTPLFWRNYVWPKLNEDFNQVYRFLSEPYPDGPNQYVEKVRANVARLERHFATAGV